MIVKLNEQLKTIKGNMIIGDGKDPITPKDAFIVCCELYKPEKMIPGRILKVLAIGTKVFNADDEVDLTDEEVKILKEVIEGNNIYVAAVTGSLLKLLEE